MPKYSAEFGKSDLHVRTASGIHFIKLRACVVLAECFESTLIRSGSKQLPHRRGSGSKVASAEYFGHTGSDSAALLAF